MPLRAFSILNGMDMQLYRRLTFGDLVEFNVLDTRVVLQKLSKDRAFLSISSCLCSNFKKLRHEFYLTLDVTFFYSLNLSFSDHVHCFVTLNDRLAVLKEPDPIPGLTSRLINRWSCSTILLRYLTLRSSAVLVRI